MAEPGQQQPKQPDQAAVAGVQLEGGTYEIIRNRLNAHGAELRKRLVTLNEGRKEVFGAIEPVLLSTERISTSNNCVPRDMVPVGDLFLFGYNVHMGLRSETHLDDVFAAYALEEHGFHEAPLELVGDKRFEEDFKDLYRYYKNTRFAKFAELGPYLYMVFHVGKGVTDIKTFKWLVNDDGTLTYVDNRSDHEVRYPPRHEFEWVRTHRDMHRAGAHPHISIMDEIFVETIGGDLTIKVEDNTATGQGIFSEPVDNPDQTLDDAEVFYADLGNLMLLRVKPYQEQACRYIVYSKKVQQACRIDSIENSCVLLPEDHGIVFSNGYYLQTGEHKEFESDLRDMLFERRVQAPNGEDTLYVFYNRASGVYVLLSYNLIEQKVESPIVCHGFSLFPSGKLIYFRADDEARKTHAIQVWQTPYVAAGHETTEKKDSHLFKIGNRDIVRCMAACHGILGLIAREDTYANLYIDIVRLSGDVVDAYFWLDHKDAANLKEVLVEIRDSASAAVDEFEKVVRVRRDTANQVRDVSEKTAAILSTARASRFESIDDFVRSLSDLRTVRGSIISLRDLRYVDEARIDELEEDVTETANRLAHRCVEFLLRADSLKSYEEQVEEQRAGIEALDKVSDGRKLEEAIAATGAELEMLVDVVSNLKIDDATQRTAIIDNISAIFATLNQVRAALRKRIESMASVEGAAEFGSQVKLLNQAVVNYLDVCDAPAKCDEYLSKVMIQVEELEGKFADFEEFVVQLAEKREEIYNAFESRKLKLVEERNRRADGLARSAERVLKGIRTRVGGLKTIEEINGYFASDLMIDKVRDVIERLTALGDTVKAGDIQAQLKTIQEDAVRQLKDRQELFVEGEDVIRFGRHNFAVNTQPLDLTAVRRGDSMHLHLTGTNFFEEIEDEAFLATRGAWDQEVVSENDGVYRAEFLAYRIFQQEDDGEEGLSISAIAAMDDYQRRDAVRKFMAPRYAEGYLKGVHDEDAARILGALLEMQGSIGLLRYHTLSRALAIVFWRQFRETTAGKLIGAKLKGYGRMLQVFSRPAEQELYESELAGLAGEFAESTGLFETELAAEAGAYLLHVLAGDGAHHVSPEADRIVRRFTDYLKPRGADKDLAAARKKVHEDVVAEVSLLRDWVGAFIEGESELRAEYRDEAVAILLADCLSQAHTHDASVIRRLEDMVGDHPGIDNSVYELNYNDFMLKLARFDRDDVPRFEHYVRAKKEILDHARGEMRLAEFMPRVLTSFVRNKLLDRVYLPLVGDNLAKQIGVVGADTRTDRMGLLMLISPPGYGKTTLMEYIANRLGIIFMKVNGPAIGHRVTSLDPAEAPNAAAREELAKLNLALEMGDNVMLYVDDIQHCNPEFLQKFISLCDAQRKIEGVYKGKTRTYDLRGKKVAVVMAGNPYTESGEMFKVPDMLSNRADTYNLGDIIGDSADLFELSYLENALTSNPALNRLATRSQKDVYGVIRIAETDSRDGVEFDAQYSAEELNEFVAVMKKLMRVRDVILTMNLEYIRSAGQADEFRTEPAFKLQGSYRNMNRLAEKTLPIMNEAELESLIFSHYENESQTLTTGSEANLLKFKELLGLQSEEEAARWTEIKKTYGRNQLLRGTGGDDRFGQVIAQMSTVKDGLDEIGQAVAAGVEKLGEKKKGAPSQRKIETSLSDATLKKLEKLLQAHGDGHGDEEGPPTQNVEIVNRVPRGMVKLLEQQFDLIRAWIEPMYRMSQEQGEDFDKIMTRLTDVTRRYETVLKTIHEGGGEIRGNESGRVVRRKKPKPKKGE